MKTIGLLTVLFTALTGIAKVKAQNSKPVTYLALGDSYTNGEAISREQSYPYQLAALLKSEKYNVQSPDVIAETGWVTGQLIDAIAHSGIIHKKYDVVTLLIGVNDQFQGYSTADYHAQFIKVLHTAIAFANGKKNHVFVLSIPDYGVTPFANGNDREIGPAIDTFNAVNKAESEKAGVHYLNITGISKRAAVDASLIAPDGLHPSAKMYALWVQQLAPMIKAQLIR
jgi:lysophospholipase L1-like esterase